MKVSIQCHSRWWRQHYLIVAFCLAPIVGGCVRPSLPVQPATQTNHPGTAQTTEVSPSGDVPDNAVFVTYQSEGGGYQIQYVEGWSVKPQKDGGVAITDIDSAERVEVRTLPAGDLSQYVTRIDEPQVKKQNQAYQRTALKPLTINQQAIVVLTYTGLSAPDAVTNKTRPIIGQRYYIPGPNQKLAILTLIIPDGVDNVDAFRQMLESFTWQ